MCYETFIRVGYELQFPFLSKPTFHHIVMKQSDFFLNTLELYAISYKSSYIILY